MRTKRLRFFSGSLTILLPLAIWALAGCKREADPNVVATVGEVQIRLAELKAAAVRRTGRGTPDPGEVLQDLIDRQALLAQARRLGLEQHPDVIRGYENLLISRLKASELSPKLEQLEVSQDEIELEHRRRPARSAATSEVRLAILCLRTHPKMSPAKTGQLHARLAAARQRILRLAPNAPDFGSVAVEYSEDQATRFKGGDLGWLEPTPERYYWDPAVLAAGFALTNIGDTSEVIQGRDGLYLVRLTGRRHLKSAPLTDVADSISHRLRIEKRRSLEQAFVQAARRLVAIQEFPLVLEQARSQFASAHEDQQTFPPVLLP
jgi:hypothetical protein